MKILCKILGRHKPQHISNFRDIKGGRGLWQCERCKDIIMAGTWERYQKYKPRNYPCW